ncbi:MAG TPA: hypothetical protein VGK89_03740 [Candidatus Eisenbacteria bacterium]|jgi:hypothetical protein
MMATLPPKIAEGARRRVVLIDFDWQDADLLPLLLQRPGVAVRLVVGERTEAAGLKMAEMCGLPRTLDLSDLTKEIFDLALVSERSPRRAQLESLLSALRTPCLTPGEFLEQGEREGDAIGAAAAGVAPAIRVEPLPPRPAPAVEIELTPSPPPPAFAAGAEPEPLLPPASNPASPAEPAFHAAPRASEPVAEPTHVPEPPVAEVVEAAAEAGAGTVPGAEDLEALLDDALETMSPTGSAGPPRPREARARASVQNLADFPSREDRAALEDALGRLIANTGATRAELHAGRTEEVELVAQAGAQDPLLRSMVGLALQLNSAQVIKGLSSPHEGRLWGAWPFRTMQHRGVLAASAIDPQGGTSPWEAMVEELRQRWDRQDRESAGRAFPLIPEPRREWLELPAFRERLELAVERNRHDGLPFSLHRLEFPGPPAAVEQLCAGLPHQLRDTDFLCHPSAREVLLLTAVPAAAYAHVRRRLLGAWEQAWRESGQVSPPPPITDLRAEMVGPEDAEGFLTAAEAWLSGF